jgi:hypothetical protein
MPKIQKPFYEQTYASVQSSGNKFVVDTIDNGKGHYLGYSKKNQEPGYFTKQVALKKAMAWMKKKGEC